MVPRRDTQALRGKEIGVKVLLDECVRKEVLELLSGWDVSHVRDLGWASLSNGELIEAASADFDVLVTVDKKMQFQQSLKGMKLSVAVLDVPDVEVETYRRFLPMLAGALRDIPQGAFYVVRDPDAGQ